MSIEDDIDEAEPHEIQPFQEVLDSLDEPGLQAKVAAVVARKESAKSNDTYMKSNGSSGLDLRTASFDTLFRVISEEYSEQDVAQVTKSVFNDAFQDLKKFESQKSQLNLIFELIGSPRYDEMNHLDLKTKTMLMSMTKKRPKVCFLCFILSFSFDLLLNDTSYRISGYCSPMQVKIVFAY